MCVRRRQGLDSLCDRQQRDRKPSPRGPRRNRSGPGPNCQGHEQQVQGNQRSRPGSFSRALLIEKWTASLVRSVFSAISAYLCALCVNGNLTKYLAQRYAEIADKTKTVAQPTFRASQIEV